MKITEGMKLGGLADLMGYNTDWEEICLPEVLRMRSILCDSDYFEKDTEEVPEHAWQSFLDDAVSPI